ncbi:MAG: UDP-N-acetylglucosamine 2-epimerase (non-hydrolyzing) [bacterium]|nr:UDP-N-acetylglucosamine 2-epimerase (non-hydrolyzing) [bacterium]
MKIITIIGARPQFIKAATISRAIRKFNLQKQTDISEIIIHTGQHFDKNMSDVFFQEMNIPKPDINLNIHSLNHGAMTGKMLEKIESFLLKEKPDWVLVYGDTNSTIAGSLAASKLHFKIAHIEAGLRSFNMRMPEEINRILTDRISDVLFCPTEASIKNLAKEGFKDFNCAVIKIGDVMFDSVLHYKQFAKKPDSINECKLNNNYMLITLHREENIENKQNFDNILNALLKISEEKLIIISAHPRLKKKLANSQIFKNAFYTIPPCSYLEMLWLLNHCELVMTDSGGLQKEAFFLKKKCITLRNETEWVETLNSGWNLLGGNKSSSIIEAYNKMIDKKIPLNKNNNEFGSGNAADKIIKYLFNYKTNI